MKFIVFSCFKWAETMRSLIWCFCVCIWSICSCKDAQHGPITSSHTRSRETPRRSKLWQHMSKVHRFFETCAITTFQSWQNQKWRCGVENKYTVSRPVRKEKKLILEIQLDDNEIRKICVMCDFNDRTVQFCAEVSMWCYRYRSEDHSSCELLSLIHSYK